MDNTQIHKYLIKRLCLVSQKDGQKQSNQNSAAVSIFGIVSKVKHKLDQTFWLVNEDVVLQLLSEQLQVQDLVFVGIDELIVCGEQFRRI